MILISAHQTLEARKANTGKQNTELCSPQGQLNNGIALQELVATISLHHQVQEITTDTSYFPKNQGKDKIRAHQ